MNEDYNKSEIIESINDINKNNKFKINTNIYLNLKKSNGEYFVNNITSELSLFFSGSRNNFDEKYNYQFITINSLNPNKYNYDYLSNKRYNLVKSKMPKFSKKYNYKKDGYILLLFSNSTGWFKNNLKNKLSLADNIINLIKDIRRYTDREIIIRLHPKDLEKHNFINSLKINNFKKVKLKKKKYYDLLDTLNNLLKINDFKKVKLKNDNLLDTLNNSYCCFTQNSKIIFDLVNIGIPLFNLNCYNVNYFNNIFIKLKYIENLENINLPDRELFLKYYYRFIFFTYELYEKDGLNKILKYYNIIDD